MKKVIMMAAFACVATLANAAACSWTLSGIQKSESTDLVAGSMVAYFMDGSTFDEFSALTTGQGAYAVGKGLSSATITVARGAATATKNFGSYAPEDKVSGYIVIFDNANATEADYYAFTAVDTKTVPGAGDVKFAKSFGTDTAGWKALSATPGPTPGPVPEPTSGLLLVLGGAALALRRRR